MVSNESLAAILNTQCEPSALCLSPWLSPPVSIGTRLQSPSTWYTDVGKMSGIFPFSKMSQFLDMYESWASGSGRGSAECSGHLLWQVPCPAAWLFPPSQNEWLLIYLKVAYFQWAVIVCELVTYSSGAFVLKIYLYFKHLNTPCFQNCTSWQELPRNKF